jgi:hypothetical protein
MSSDPYPAGIEAKLPARALKALRSSHSPVVLLTKGKPTMVVQDFASFQEQRESLLMLKLVLQSERSIAAGRTSPTKSVIARLRASVAKRHNGK